MEKRIFLRIRLRWMVLAPIVLSLLFGCGGQGKDFKKIEGDPEILYKQGLARFNKRDYPDALKKFEELKSSFPDSPPYTVWAELKVGDCHFLNKEYVEAIAAYEEFKKTHPGNEEIPYVQFQIGMSYFNQMLTLDRDQTPTKKALSSFEYLIASYPPSLFTEKASEKVGVCKKRLADHEFYVGDFYYKHESFQAAASRFEGLLEKYPKNPEEDKTLYLLGKSCLELGQWEKAEVAFMKIVTEYPKSLHFKEARAILDKGMPIMGASRKTKAFKTTDEGAAIEPGKMPLVKFEEEGKQPVSLTEEKKVDLRRKDEKSTSLMLPKDEAKKQVSPLPVEPAQENRANAVPPSIEAKKAEPILPVEPMKEDQAQVILPLPPPNTASRMEVKPGEENRVAAVTSAPAPSKDEAKKQVSPLPVEPAQENRTDAVPPSIEAKKAEPILPVEPMKEDRAQVILPLPPPNTASGIEVKPDEEKRAAAVTSAPAPSKEKVNTKVPPETKEAKLADPADRSQPIDVTSDKVEARWKENLVIFKGNVIARQKDMVIYADSLEVTTNEDGKGIERAVAGGNVKIQQGPRIADCQKAVFYNVDQKLVLTGDPKLSEGDNIILGDEIIFFIDKNRVDVKGGPSGRGKAKIQPGEIEKFK